MAVDRPSGHVDAAMLLAIREEITAAVQPLIAKLETAEAERSQQATALALLAQKAQAAESSKPGIGGKIIDALIFWAVPLAGACVLWLIKAAGQIPAGAHS